MEATVVWVNQKAANFLRDHKGQPEPADQPNQTCRGSCRLLFLLVLSTTFALSVAYTISKASPNIRVTAITNLKKENHNFIPRHVYNTSNLTEAERLDIVSCVCNTTAFSWKEFTKFYIINENSTKWHIEYDHTVPNITLPTDSDLARHELQTNTVRTMQQPATSDTFCSIASLWPSDSNTSSCNSSFCSDICWAMSGRLLAPTKEEKINLDPEILLESPILLTPEVLRVLVIQHARELLLRTGEEIKVLVTDPTANVYNDAMTLFLLNALTVSDLQDWESYFQGAMNQTDSLGMRFYYGDPNPKVLVLNNTYGIAFLHMDINWTRYAEMCDPQYCEVTQQMNLLRKVYWGFALVGGFTTVMLAVVNIVLWPAFAFLLNQWGRNTSPPNPAMETPNPSENEVDGLLPSGARSDESEMVSMSIAPGPLPPLEKTKSTRLIHLERMVSRGREAQGPEDK